MGASAAGQEGYSLKRVSSLVARVEPFHQVVDDPLPRPVVVLDDLNGGSTLVVVRLPALHLGDANNNRGTTLFSILWNVYNKRAIELTSSTDRRVHTVKTCMRDGVSALRLTTGLTAQRSNVGF